MGKDLLDDLPPLGGKIPKALNLIRKTVDVLGNMPVVAMCPYCEADLSKVCLGRYVDVPGGTAIDTWHPIACPECHHPLLYVAQPSEVIRARRIPT